MSVPASCTEPELDEDVVLGVDTHKDLHVAAVTSPLGQTLATASFPATAVGYEQLVSWVRSHGRVRRAGVEGTGSYGAALARYLIAERITVVEVNRPDRAQRRRAGKSDVIDAEAAARAVVSHRATATAKAGNGPVEQIRVYKVAKDSAVKAKVQATNQLKSLLVTADPNLRQSLTGMSTKVLIERCAALPDEDAHGDVATVHALRILARRIQHLVAEITDLLARITAVVKAPPGAATGARMHAVTTEGRPEACVKRRGWCPVLMTSRPRRARLRPEQSEPPVAQNRTHHDQSPQSPGPSDRARTPPQ
jgi:transposase